MDSYFYINPDELEEVENIIENKELEAALGIVVDSFSNFSVDKPVLKLVKDKSKKNLLKFLIILNEKSSLINVYHNSFYHINGFNEEHNRQKIIIDKNVNGIRNYFKGSIMDENKEVVVFEVGSPSVFLSLIYDF